MSGRALPTPPGSTGARRPLPQPKENAATNTPPSENARPLPQPKSGVPQNVSPSPSPPQKPEKPEKPDKPPKPEMSSIPSKLTKPPRPASITSTNEIKLPPKPVKPNLPPPSSLTPVKGPSKTRLETPTTKALPTLPTKSKKSDENEIEPPPKPEKPAKLAVSPTQTRRAVPPPPPAAVTLPPKPLKPVKSLKSSIEGDVKSSLRPVPPARRSIPVLKMDDIKLSDKESKPSVGFEDDTNSDSKSKRKSKLPQLGSPKTAMALPSALKKSIESIRVDTSPRDDSSDSSSPETSSSLKSKLKRPSSKKKKSSTSHRPGTLRFFSKKQKEDSTTEQPTSSVEEPIRPSAMKREENDVSDSDFKRSSKIIAQSLQIRSLGTQQPQQPSAPAQPESEPAKLLKVDSGFNKQRVVRVEFGPENTSKAITVTPRTSPLEAFEGIMAKISKGLPPERRDTLVAKYAKYSLYRLFENGDIEPIYEDEPLLSPLQIVGSSGPKFLFTDQKVEITNGRNDEMTSINFGNVMQETHMKEEQKAVNPVEEILMTERKFLFDTDLLLEMVFKPLHNEDIIPDKTIQNIFLNMQQINSFHRELYRRLQIDNTIAGIANVFDDETISYLEKVYTTYLGFYENALDVFYSTRDHSDKLRKFLTRLSAESPVFKDKSLNNLLVTPMQRVCKYELLIKNVIHQEKKREKPDTDSIKILTNVMKRLNSTLQLIDKRRNESDEWQNIIKLEEKLGLSHPLRKPGRVILLQDSFGGSRILLHEGSHSNKTCNVILFNDLLLRAYKSVKTGQYKVLDTTSLSQLVLVDKNHTYGAANSISLCNLDPRAGVLELTLQNEDKRKDWISNLEVNTISIHKACAFWGIPNAYNPVIYCVDSCSWSAAYITQCRFMVTTNFILLSWERFGLLQHEIIPLSTVIHIESNSKDGEILIQTNSWKEDYRLKKFNNLNNTFTVLKSVWQTFKKNPVDIETTISEKPTSPWAEKLQLTPEETKTLWSIGTSQTIKENEVIIQRDTSNPFLYIVNDGSVIQTKSNGSDTEVLNSGEMFGMASFVDDTIHTIVHVVGGQGGAKVSSINRNTLLTKLSNHPELLMKLFAAISRSMIPK